VQLVGNTTTYASEINQPTQQKWEAGRKWAIYSSPCATFNQFDWWEKGKLRPSSFI